MVSPLISLMVDQVQQLLKNGHRLATYINSSLDRDEIRLIVDELEAGKYKLVYISPKSCNNLLSSDYFKKEECPW
ncbi:hypothetical protein ACLMAB_11665 [Brevibacillus laterosporus]